MELRLLKWKLVQCMIYKSTQLGNFPWPTSLHTSFPDKSGSRWPLLWMLPAFHSPFPCFSCQSCHTTRAKTVAWSCSFAMHHALLMACTRAPHGHTGQISPQQAGTLTTEDVACLQNIYYWRSDLKSKETSIILGKSGWICRFGSKGGEQEESTIT